MFLPLPDNLMSGRIGFFVFQLLISLSSFCADKMKNQMFAGQRLNFIVKYLIQEDATGAEVLF